MDISWWWKIILNGVGGGCAKFTDSIVMTVDETLIIISQIIIDFIKPGKRCDGKTDNIIITYQLNMLFLVAFQLISKCERWFNSLNVSNFV